MKHPMDKYMKKLDGWDLGLTKLSVFFFTLFLLKIIPGLMDLTHNTNIWVFLVIAIILTLRPIKRVYCKR